MKFEVLCVVLLVAALSAAMQEADLNPCVERVKKNPCPRGKQCRLKTATCSDVTSACPPVPTCLPITPEVASCRHGHPVRNDTNTSIVCSGKPEERCPDNTKCKHVLDTPSVCCWKPANDPCSTTTCPEGRICKIILPHCLVPPCEPVSVCRVSVKDACSTTVCPFGKVCKIFTPHCLNPPCAPVGFCRKTPTTPTTPTRAPLHLVEVTTPPRMRCSEISFIAKIRACFITRQSCRKTKDCTGGSVCCVAGWSCGKKCVRPRV